MNKKIVKIAVIISYIFLIKNNIYANSSNFLNMINILGVPRYNSNKEEINEDVYNVYKVFCYSSPEKYKGSNPAQRWKNSKYGLWNKSGGAYKGSGTRGEYMVLGKNYGGAIINNYYFPLDAISPNTPEYWNYVVNDGALTSWSDSKAYRFIEQRDYMKQAKLVFNDLSNRDNADNPAKFREYNITANKIGLNKAKLDTSSSWKTRGVISVKFKRNGNLRYAFFFTNPMSANANIRSTINSSSSDYILTENQKQLDIPIDYGAEAYNLIGYAKKEHIKQIKSEIYIDNLKVGEISGSKTTNVGNKYNFVVTRQTPNLSPNNQFVIRVDSYMYTEFALDGIMKNSVSKIINVLVEPEKVDPINTYNVRQIEKQNNNTVVRPLAQTLNTINEDGVGLSEAGRKIAIKLDLNTNANNISNVKLLIGKTSLDRNILEINKIIKASKISELYSLNNNVLLIDFELSNNLSPTIYGWKSLREKTQSYYTAREQSEIATRINKPYIINIEYVYNGKLYYKEILIDIIDDYISNINYTVEDQIVNKNEIKVLDSLNNWVLNDK